MEHAVEHDPDLENKAEKLEAWFKTKLPGAEKLSLSALEKAGSGWSNETCLFELRWTQDGQSMVDDLVVRWPPETPKYYPENDVRKQIEVIKSLEESIIPVPKIMWVEDDADILGVPFYIMQRIDGEMVSGHPPGPHGQGLFFEATPEERAQMWRSAIEAIARIHTLDWHSLGLSFLGEPRGGTDALDRQIEHWERLANWAATEPLPVLHAGFDWLKENTFDVKRIGLCWGDAGLQNLAFRHGKVAYVLDWEDAHLGAPESDLAYFMLLDLAFADNELFPMPRLKGLPEMEETIAYYESLTGRSVENIFYHQVFQTIHLAVHSVLAARAMGHPDFAKSNWPTRRLAQLLTL